MPRLQEHRREEWSKPLDRMRKIKLDEEQKRRDAFTARRMMSASHAPVAESPSSSVEHERRAQPCKRARIASEADSSNSTVMQDVTTQGPPGADTTSGTNMRDSSKRQADVGVEELEQDTNDGGDEAATLGDDGCRITGVSTRSVRSRCHESEQSCSYSINDSHSWIVEKFDHGHHV